MIPSKNERIIGLVLSISAFKEDSAIVTMATKQGIQGFLCSHIYRMKSNLKCMLLAFNLVEVDISRTKDDFAIAKQAHVLSDISASYLDLKKNLFFSFLQETSMAFFRYGDNYPLEEVSFLIMNSDQDLITLSLLYLGVVYTYLGIRMDTKECVKCHRKDHLVYFSFEDGGFLCSDCTKERCNPIELYILKFAFMDINARTVSKVVPKEPGKKILLALLQNLMDYYDIKKISSLSMLLEAIS